MSTPAQTFNLSDFRDATLSEHNIKRALHHAPALTLDATLNAQAQAWAQHLLSTGQLQYDPNLQGAGENLLAGEYLFPSNPPMTQEVIDLYKQYYPNFEPPTEFTGQQLADRVLSAWYGEMENYSYVTTQSINGSAIDHFTQLVWRDSRGLGCGAAWEVSPSGDKVKVYVVCRYQASGNTMEIAHGQTYEDARLESYGNNVLPA